MSCTFIALLGQDRPPKKKGEGTITTATSAITTTSFSAASLEAMTILHQEHQRPYYLFLLSSLKVERDGMGPAGGQPHPALLRPLMGLLQHWQGRSAT